VELWKWIHERWARRVEAHGGRRSSLARGIQLVPCREDNAALAQYLAAVNGGVASEAAREDGKTVRAPGPAPRCRSSPTMQTPVTPVTGRSGWSGSLVRVAGDSSNGAMAFGPACWGMRTARLMTTWWPSTTPHHRRGRHPRRMAGTAPSPSRRPSTGRRRTRRSRDPVHAPAIRTLVMARLPRERRAARAATHEGPIHGQITSGGRLCAAEPTTQLGALSLGCHLCWPGRWIASHPKPTGRIGSGSALPRRRRELLG